MNRRKDATAAAAAGEADRNGRMKTLVHDMLVELGEDPTRGGLLKTPERVVTAMRFLTDGYRRDPRRVLTGAIFREEYNEMVIVRDIDFYSMCEHHMLPFFGRCHVAYIPNGCIVGLSKLPRVVDIFARRLQVQERMTQQIAESINDVLKPLGVAVVCEARHMCMMMRGVEKENSVTTTSAMFGEFSDNPKTRAEFLRLIRGGQV